MDPELISAAVSAVGNIFSGIGGFFAGAAKKKAYENAANQVNAEEGVNAQNALQEGEVVAAKGAVAAAANGGGLTGSSLGVIQNLSDQAMFNARTAIYRGQTQAQNDVYQGKVAQSQGLLGLVGAISPAVSSLTSGFAKSAMQAQQLSALKALRGEGGSGGGGGGFDNLGADGDY